MRLNLSRIRQDSGLRRQILFRFYGILILAIVLATGTFIAVVMSSSTVSFTSRIGEAGDIIAASTLLLAIVAAIVALQAYAAATGLPDLSLQLRFEFSRSNIPVFEAAVSDNNWLQAKQFKQLTANVYLRNNSRYAARSPAVIVRLQGMALTMSGDWPAMRKWEAVDFANTVGITAIQWDGGPDYTIHGNSVRHLPIIRWDHLFHIPEWGTPSFVLELLADGGYRREIKIPVDFVVDGESRFPQNECKNPKDWA